MVGQRANGLGAFAVFHLFKGLRPQGEMSDEAGSLHPSLPPNLGKVSPGVKEGVKGVGK